MKGITWTQVAQYCVLILAFLLIPVAAISPQLTGTAVPKIGFDQPDRRAGLQGKYLLETLNQIGADLGFAEYTSAFSDPAPSPSPTCSPSPCVSRFGSRTAPSSSGSIPCPACARRLSAFMPCCSSPSLHLGPGPGRVRPLYPGFDLNNAAYAAVPSWFGNWEKTGLLAWSG